MGVAFMHRKDRVTKPNETCVGEQLIEWPCPVVVEYCEIFLVRCCYLYICVLACKYRNSSSMRLDLGPDEAVKRSYPKSCGTSRGNRPVIPRRFMGFAS